MVLEQQYSWCSGNNTNLAMIWMTAVNHFISLYSTHEWKIQLLVSGHFISLAGKRAEEGRHTAVSGLCNYSVSESDWQCVGFLVLSQLEFVMWHCCPLWGPNTNKKQQRETLLCSNKICATQFLSNTMSPTIDYTLGIMCIYSQRVDIF